MCIHMCVHMCIYIYIHTYIHTYIHYIHTYVHTITKIALVVFGSVQKGMGPWVAGAVLVDRFDSLHLTS